MNRRNFLRKGAIASTLGVAALAGCTAGGSSGESPPRESEVFEEITVNDDGSIDVTLESLPIVQSRAKITSDSSGSDNGSNETQNALSSVASDLSPVGVASAAKGRAARGSSGGSRSAVAAGATGRNGRAKLHGGTGSTYVFWWNNHKDEVEDHDARVKNVAIARIADPDTQENDLPGPGVPDDGWDKKVGNPSATVAFNPQDEGWYRVGAQLVSKQGNHDFGWDAVDLLLKEDDSGSMAVEQDWKVSPRL